MGLDDSFHERQSQTNPLGASRKERLENETKVLLLNPMAIVRDRDPNDLLSFEEGDVDEILPFFLFGIP